MHALRLSYPEFVYMRQIQAQPMKTRDVKKSAATEHLDGQHADRCPKGTGTCIKQMGLNTREERMFTG